MRLPVTEPIADSDAMTLLLVALGAALGAPIRWWVDRTVQLKWAPLFPWGTFIVNVVGSGLLGVLAAVWATNASVMALFGIGLCGSMTTFSSFAYETQRLATSGAKLVAVANVGLSLVVCLAAAALGWSLAA